MEDKDQHIDQSEDSITTEDHVDADNGTRDAHAEEPSPDSISRASQSAEPLRGAVDDIVDDVLEDDVRAEAKDDASADDSDVFDDVLAAHISDDVFENDQTGHDELAVDAEREDVSAPEVSRVTPLDDIQSQVKALDVILQKTAQAARASVYAEGALWFFAAMCAWCISGLMFALITPQLTKIGILMPLLVGAVVLVLVGFIALVWFWRQRPSTLLVAKEIQQHQSGWRNDLVSSMIFGEQLLNDEFDPTASRALASAHIAQTVKRVMREVKNGHLGHLLPRRDMSPAAMSVAAALVVMILPSLIAPDWVWNSLVGSAESRTQFFTPQTRKTPLTGSVSITYQYPKYSGQRARRELFTTGDIRGLKGTEVTLETFSLIKGNALRSLELVLKTEKGEQARALKIARDRRITTTFVLSESGSYFFRAKSITGTMFESPKARIITVIPDKKPRVQVLSHKGTIEVSPKDVLEIKYSVEDDFGLTLIQKTHQFSNTKDDPTRTSVDVPALQNKPRQYQGSFKLDLSQWDLQPKDSVVFKLEATDNNTLTGPGVGASEPIVFVVSSPDDKHLKNLEDQQAIVEALVGVLANFLEAPVGKRVLQSDESYTQVVGLTMERAEFARRFTAIRKANKPLGKVLKQMGVVTAKLKEDPLMVPRNLAMFEALYVQLNEMYQNGAGMLGKTEDLQKSDRLKPKDMQRVATYAASMETALEKGILRLEDLLVSQKIDSINATTKEVKRLKERLKTLLKKYQASKDPELKKAIKREIQRLRQRMAEMMQRMQMQTSKLPQEHVNMEALKQAQMQSDSKKLVDNFQNIEKLLEKDDIDGALKALDRMTANLDSMTKQMDKDFDDTKPSRMQEFDKEVAKLMDDVNDLSALQKDVEKKTSDLQKQMMKEQSKAMDQQMDETSKALLKKVAEQKKALKNVDTKKMTAPNQAAVNRLKQRMERLEKSLKQKDIDQSLKESKRFLNEMESLRFSMQMAQRYVRRPSGRYDRLRDNLRKIRPMNKRGEEIVEDLQDLMDTAERQQAKAAGDPRTQKLSEQQGKVQQQAKKLEQRISEASKKYPTLKQKMASDMKQAQQSMKQAKQNLKQRKMQSALDSERQTLESLRKMKQSMKDALKNQRKPDSGKSNSNRERVEIPGNSIDENKAYRENIKKGMKEDRLKNYASDIESYYKSLVE